MLEAIGAWTSAFYHPMDDLDFPSSVSSGHADVGEDHERDRKRQRRSIFFAGPADDDSDADEPENVVLGQAAAALDCLRPEGLQCQLLASTPYPANPLSKGTCILTPGFSRHAPLLGAGDAPSFVAVHEEPNSGYRNYMEDRSAAMTVGGVAYLGVYDGHGGIDASSFLQRHLLTKIQARMQPGCDLHTALSAAYSETNAAFRATGSIQGSTATTVILERRRLIAANVGDSPAFVIKKNGEVYSVIQEHKIEGEEAARIAAHGAPIYRSATGPAYMGTPDGTRWLNMSRAFGDFVYPAISCEPYVCSLDVSDGRFLVIGSDGLTEKWSVTEAAQYLTQLAAAGASLATMCHSLVERSLARGSTDNISCMVVDLEAYMRHADACSLPPTQIVTATQVVAGGATATPAADVAPAAAEEDTAGVVPPSPLHEQEQQQPEQSPGERHRTPATGRRPWPCAQDDAGLHDDLVCKETPIDEQENRSPCRQLAARASPLAAALASAAAEALSGSRTSAVSPCALAADGAAHVEAAPEPGMAEPNSRSPACIGTSSACDGVPEAKL